MTMLIIPMVEIPEPPKDQPANLGFLEYLAEEAWQDGFYTRSMRISEAINEIKKARGQ